MTSSDALTKVALRFGLDRRVELAAELARSVDAAEPARSAPTFPELTLSQSRIAAGIVLIVMLGTAANYFWRLYTCAPGVSLARQVWVGSFGLSMLVTVYLGLPRIYERTAADALRLPPAERRLLLETLRDSLARDAMRVPGWRGLSRAQIRAAIITAVLLPAVATIDYVVRLYACVGGTAEAMQRIVIFAIIGGYVSFRYLRRAIRDTQAAVASVVGHS